MDRQIIQWEGESKQSEQSLQPQQSASTVELEVPSDAGGCVRPFDGTHRTVWHSEVIREITHQIGFHKNEVIEHQGKKHKGKKASDRIGDIYNVQLNEAQSLRKQQKPQ